tara:strand:+ start:1114 stop:2238 length:1125 start_codon:yes stop_codon:yes gene_type:complete
MSYLDPKEQVIDLQLTPYGEFLLSVGRLNPEFYAFFDEDIIYNSEFANNASEDQSKIKERILDETPRLAAQKSISGREEDYISKRFINLKIDDKRFEIDLLKPELYGFESYNTTEADILNIISTTPEPMQQSLYMKPLGKYDPSKGFAPGWNVAFLKTDLDSSTDRLSISGSKGVLQYHIPQLNVSIEYKIKRNSRGYNSSFEPENLAGEVDITSVPTNIDPTERIDFLPFYDGSSIETLQDFLVIRVEESNTFFEKENFEVELFEVVPGATQIPAVLEEELIKKPFYKNRDALLEDVLDGNVAFQSVERYFDFLVDREIDGDIMCPLIGFDKTKQFYNTKMFDCESEPIISLTDNQIKQNIYFDDDDTKDVCE